MQLRIHLVALLITILSLASVLILPTSTASALTDAEKQACYDKWNGVSFSTGSEKHEEWKDDKTCNNSEACTTVAGSMAGYRVGCINPAFPDNPCSPITFDREKCNDQRGVTECENENEGNCAKNTSFSFCGRNENVGITCLFKDVLSFLSVIVGLAVLGGIIFGAITYSSSQGNPAQVQKGITIIANSLLGLALYILMWAIIQWLIPGGVFE